MALDTTVARSTKLGGIARIINRHALAGGFGGAAEVVERVDRVMIAAFTEAEVIEHQKLQSE